jgi:hypothetical protein
MPAGSGVGPVLTVGVGEKTGLGVSDGEGKAESVAVTPGVALA